jgi:hypothetical protein
MTPKRSLICGIAEAQSRRLEEREESREEIRSNGFTADISHDRDYSADFRVSQIPACPSRQREKRRLPNPPETFFATIRPDGSAIFKFVQFDNLRLR